MNETVVVRRFIRTEEPKSNLGGATMLFTMDYTDRVVDIQMSLCAKEDNFEKIKGVEAAQKQPIRSVNLDRFRSLADSVGGFTKAYTVVLMADWVSEKGLTGSEKKFLKDYLGVGRK